MATSRGPEQDIAPPSLDGGEIVTLLAALEEGILQVQGGRIVNANPAVARMVGARLESVLDRRVGDLIQDLDGRPLQDPASSDVARLRTADGSLLPISVYRLSPGLLVVVDRSRERTLEQEIGRLERVPGVAPEEESREALLAMIEHEIRTPVTVVNGYARMLLEEREGPLNETQSEFLDTIRRSARRIEALLDNLLALESGGAPDAVRIVRKPTSLHEIVRHGLAATRPLTEERRLNLIVDLHPDADALDADAVRLEQVVTNLVSNAVKFTPEGSVVRIGTGVEEGEKGDVIWIAIADEGPGVAPDEAERIFRPFTRGRAARECCVQGVGLGLAICRTIIEAHGGSIEAIPSSEGGLFRVTVPVGA
jgi:signal transduction histidine kinase